MEVNGKVREIFTDDEKLHMIDVRRLNLTANALLIISAVIAVCGIIYASIKKETGVLFSRYRNSLLMTMIFISVLGIWIMIDFDSFWTMFHHVFFPSNELWLLDLRKDILIMIVPPEFFNHLVVRIVISAVVLLLSFFFLFAFLRKDRRRS